MDIPNQWIFIALLGIVLVLFLIELAIIAITIFTNKKDLDFFVLDDTLKLYLYSELPRFNKIDFVKLSDRKTETYILEKTACANVYIYEDCSAIGSCKCSNCGSSLSLHRDNFCHQCGSKIDEWHYITKTKTKEGE